MFFNKKRKEREKRLYEINLAINDRHNTLQQVPKALLASVESSRIENLVFNYSNLKPIVELGLNDQFKTISNLENEFKRAYTVILEIEGLIEIKNNLV